jgi:nicotinamide-nucleotide amidase
MIPDDISQAAEHLLETCRRAGLKIATVESCTGGLLAGALTGIAGSSDVVDRGFVTYTNQAKSEMVGVPPGLFDTVGAVSAEVARAMAEGGVSHSPANLAAGITGVAGPGGGSAEKPVGLVHIAASRAGGETLHERNVFPGDRQAVRLASVRVALAMMQRLAEQ